MAKLINAKDLKGLKITPLKGGRFFVSAHCPLCRDLVSLRIGTADVQMGHEVVTACSSGSDCPASFQLSARYSPEETDDPSGVGVWGEIFL